MPYWDICGWHATLMCPWNCSWQDFRCKCRVNVLEVCVFTPRAGCLQSLLSYRWCKSCNCIHSMHFHFAFTNWICDQIPERLTAKVKRSAETATWLIRDSFICVLCLKSQSCSNQSLMCFSCCSQCEHRIKGLHWGSEELLTVGSSFRYCLCACFTCLDDYYTVWCLVSFQGIEIWLYLIWLYLIVFNSLFFVFVPAYLNHFVKILVFSVSWVYYQCLLCW